MVRCPTCAKPFDPRESRSMPFCSERCQRIDMNRWLNEEISIPYRELPEDGSSGYFPDEHEED